MVRVLQSTTLLFAPKKKAPCRAFFYWPGIWNWPGSFDGGGVGPAWGGPNISSNFSGGSAPVVELGALSSGSGGGKVEKSGSGGISGSAGVFISGEYSGA